MNFDFQKCSERGKKWGRRKKLRAVLSLDIHEQYISQDSGANRNYVMSGYFIIIIYFFFFYSPTVGVRDLIEIYFPHNTSAGR